MKNLYREYTQENQCIILTLEEPIKKSVNTIKQSIRYSHQDPILRITIYNSLFRRKTNKCKTYTEAFKLYETKFLIKINNSYYYSIFRSNVNYRMIKRINIV